MKKEIMNYETLLKITHGIVVSKEPEEIAILIVESVKKSCLTYPKGFDWQRSNLEKNSASSQPTTLASYSGLFCSPLGSEDMESARKGHFWMKPG